MPSPKRNSNTAKNGVTMTARKIGKEAGAQGASCELSLGVDSAKGASEAPGNHSKETKERPPFSSPSETTSALQRVPISVRGKIKAKRRPILSRTTQPSFKPTILPSNLVASTKVGEKLRVATTNDPKITLGLRKRTTLSSIIAVKQAPSLHESKSSHSAPSTCTSPSGKMPSRSAPALKAGSSKSHRIRIATPPPSKTSSHLPDLQPPFTIRSNCHRHEATSTSSPRDAGMAPPGLPSTVVSPQHGLNLPVQVDRRHRQVRSYQSKNDRQADHSHWLWRNFKKYGELFSITINDNSGQYASRSATVCYKPPPAVPFWERREGVNYQHGDRTSRFVQVRLDRKQSKNREIPSPIRPNVRYNEEHTLVGDRIDFGVLTEPSSFLALKTREADIKFKVKFQLNLRNQEITVYFPSPISSINSGLVVREYRFKVALDQNFALSQVETSGDNLILLLDIDKPPPYSKKLSEAATGSHVDDARKWTAEDLWARQTDIADTKEALLSSGEAPVSVRNSFVSIDIGRWLAFRLSFSKSQENRNTLAIIQNALRDFNVLIKDNTQLKVSSVAVTNEPVLWKVLNERNTIRHATASSSLQDLVTYQITLSFPVRYQLEVCVSHGYLSEYAINEDFLRRLATLPSSKAVQLLEAVDLRGQKSLQPAEIFDDLEFRKPVRKPKLPDNCIEIYHATVTATKIYFNTPSIEITNRVIRQYKQHADRFLRVRFEDDEYRGSTRLYPSVNNRMTNIFARVRRTLKHGIVVGDRHYKFLAWGNSQLREHGAYFFADQPGVNTADEIRAKMGEFSKEKIVAKCAARMGQCFSTTRPLTCRIPRVHQGVCIPDIKTSDGKYTFTDGVGKMSDMIARLAAIQMGIKDEIPSVLQFRLGGCKGVLAIDPNMQGVIDLRVRESQFKFASASNDLEIIRCSSFATADLNRQLILVLSELGVSDRVFLNKQEELINDINNAMKSDDVAVKALLDRVDPNLMTPVIADLIAKGRFRAVNEPFVTSVLHLWRSWNLKYLKEKAKLPIPKSAFLLGCTDETQTLRGHCDRQQIAENTSYEKKEKVLPEIFLQITDPITRKVRVIEGICVVARNPSLHRGDVRVVKAIDVPALHHLRDAVVFPQIGDRDLPSMCSGGDLDGDDFIVIWDEDLLPTVWNADPFHYTPPTPKQAEGDVTTEQIISFFVDYMENDFLGRIAHAHLAWADDKGLDSEECLELVQLHSLSVDFPKTGVAAPMEKRLQRVDGTPHFMEKKGFTYRSHKILGQLYDAVEKVKFKPKYQMSFDSRIINAMRPPDNLYQHVKILKGSYDESMRQLMAQHKIKTEFEIWTTFVLDHSKKSNDFKFHEEIGRLSATLKEQYFDEIATLMGGRDLEHLAPFAVAAYQVTQAEVDKARKPDDDEQVESEEMTEMPFISFPWVLHETLTKIAVGALRRSTSAGDAQSINDAGISFDEEGNPVFPDLTDNLLSLQGDWLGQHHADPSRNDLVVPSPASETDGTVEPASSQPNGCFDPTGLSDPSAIGADVVEGRMRAMLVEDSDSE